MGDREELLQQEQVILELLESTSFPPKEGPLINAVYDLLHNIERKDRTRASQHIARVQEYILENYSDSTLSLESVAERIGITSSYLSRLFKKETGSSFVDYVNTVRVQKAKFLLAQSELKIKDIAYQTGFHSIQNFFRIFKRMTGDPRVNIGLNKRTFLDRTISPFVAGFGRSSLLEKATCHKRIFLPLVSLCSNTQIFLL